MKTALFFLLNIALIGFSQAQTKYYVRAGFGNDLNRGLSWDQAFDNIQTALNLNGNHDTIWVAQGTYYPDKGTATVNDARTSSFILDIGVNLNGGFSGSET